MIDIRTDAPLSTVAPRWVVVTRPDRPGLLDELAWRYRLAPWVDVLADRRRGEPRQRQESRGADLRLGERRGVPATRRPARLPARASRRRLRRVRGDRPRGRAVPRVRRDGHVRDAALRRAAGAPRLAGRARRHVGGPAPRAPRGGAPHVRVQRPSALGVPELRADSRGGRRGPVAVTGRRWAPTSRRISGGKSRWRNSLMATITVTMRRAGDPTARATASVSASVTGRGSGHESGARGSPASRPKRERELAFHDVAVDRQDAEAHAVGAPAEGLHADRQALGASGSTRASPQSTCCRPRPTR